MFSFFVQLIIVFIKPKNTNKKVFIDPKIYSFDKKNKKYIDPNFS